MEKCRVFSFADRVCPMAPSGGPGGVNYRLYEANRRKKYFEKLYCVFSDRVLEYDAELILNLVGRKPGDKDHFLTLLIKLHEYYRFTNEDVFIFHDVMSANIFEQIFKSGKTVLVYHQQGTLYREWQYFTGEENLEFKEALDSTMKAVFSNTNCVAFPSQGSIESIIESDDSLKEIIDSCKKAILYNGCDCEKGIAPQSEQAKSVINSINTYEGPAFITAATLNEAKGVEQIPEYLAKIKEKYGDILWVVIGSGVKEKELEENIKKYDIESNTIWVKDRLPHDDLLAIYQYTDFYILTHRFSIFDFATIEAMHYGNIPILTPVGGNKEMIVDGNGIFINDLSSIAEFDKFMEEEDVNIAREKNVLLSEEKFSEDAFIRGYAEVVHNL